MDDELITSGRGGHWRPIEDAAERLLLSLTVEWSELDYDSLGMHQQQALHYCTRATHTAERVIALACTDDSALRFECIVSGHWEPYADDLIQRSVPAWRNKHVAVEYGKATAVCLAPRGAACLEMLRRGNPGRIDFLNRLWYDVERMPRGCFEHRLIEGVPIVPGAASAVAVATAKASASVGEVVVTVNNHVPAPSPRPPVEPPEPPKTHDANGLTGEAKALALLVQHPEWSNEKIAEHVPCARTTLNRWPKFQKARKAMRATPPPRGYKDADGRVEASE